MSPKQLSLFLLLVAFPAWADEGALSVDLGGAFHLLRAPVPHDAAGVAPLARSLQASVGLRYALSNAWEVAGRAFYEPRVDVFAANARVRTEAGDLGGTLKHGLERHGVTAGVRHLRGRVVRPVVGAEVGWSRRRMSAIEHYRQGEDGSALRYELPLQDVSVSNLAVGATLGVEWAFTDTWSLAFLPRVEWLLGDSATQVIALPLCLSWSFYP